MLPRRNQPNLVQKFNFKMSDSNVKKRLTRQDTHSHMFRVPSSRRCHALRMTSRKCHALRKSSPEFYDPRKSSPEFYNHLDVFQEMFKFLGSPGGRKRRGDITTPGWLPGDITTPGWLPGDIQTPGEVPDEGSKSQGGVQRRKCLAGWI